MEQVKASLSKFCKPIKGSYDPDKDLKLDPTGYFLIRINPESKLLELGFCEKNNEISILIRGNTAEEVYNTFLRQGIKITPQHSAYLGKELEKAEIAKRFDLEYVQDKPLEK